MKTIIKALIKTLPFYLCLLIIIMSSSCDTNEDADRISVTPQERPTIASVDPASAQVGAEVTITGTNFSAVASDNEVSFNGNVAEIVSANSTSIVAIVPEAATSGVVDISVINFKASGPTFTLEAPLPIITSIDPLSATENTVVTITGENFGITTTDNAVSFNGTLADIMASSSTSITTSVPAGATTGPVSVTAPGGTVLSSSNFTVLTITTLSIPITSNDDDVEEIVVLDANYIPDPLDPDPPFVVGYIDLGSSDLELGEISEDQGLLDIGIRFNNVEIPQGATITNAQIQFKCDTEGADPVEITIFGENVGNAASFVDELFNLSIRPRTTANAVWSVPEWVAAGDRLEAQLTVDFSSVVQEIVNRTDWVSGNSINIIMTNTGVSATATSTSGGRETENYSSSKPDDGAELTISFQ